MPTMKLNARRVPLGCKAQAPVARSVRARAAAVQEKQEVSKETVEKCINTIRFLSIDAVNKANSGHPGAPMGCAPMTYVLWNEFMNFNPKNPKWINRDRFVLSVGHASMLLYSMLYLCGFDDVSMDDIKQFRQFGSKTPGHPENFVTKGVEVTTGPLGQGIANAVGIAASEAHLAARFNKPDSSPVIDHYTYCILGDGCQMEGISQEACSLAGHWGLGKLIAFYDDNEISIDGSTQIAFTEDVRARFKALNWQVLDVEDGNNDVDAIRKAVDEAKKETGKPTLINVKTLIGYGSPNKVNSYAAHGAPLGADETQLTREQLQWQYGEFEVPDEVLPAMRDARVEQGKSLEEEWNKNFEAYKSSNAEEAAELESIISGKLPSNWASALPSFDSSSKPLATRAHSQTMLNAIAPEVPGFWGGSADLAGSNLTLMKMFGDFQKGSYEERNVRFGVREHGMGAIGNGMAAYAPGMIPYTATFFIFTDYMRASMRVAALSELRHVFVMTHDSIGLGEDGPTHQPIEHLASFRAMPNMYTMRPCGGTETAGCYKVALERDDGPCVLALSRQGMTEYDGCSMDGVAKGAYVVKDAKDGSPSHILIGTGTELELCMQAAEKLEADGVQVRVVSMPCTELFDAQSESYRESVLPSSVTKRVSVEAGSTFGWLKYIGFGGKAMGVDTFGASSPAGTAYEKFGLTTDEVVKTAKSL